MASSISTETAEWLRSLRRQHRVRVVSTKGVVDLAIAFVSDSGIYIPGAGARRFYGDGDKSEPGMFSQITGLRKVSQLHLKDYPGCGSDYISPIEGESYESLIPISNPEEKGCTLDWLKSLQPGHPVVVNYWVKENGQWELRQAIRRVENVTDRRVLILHAGLDTLINGLPADSMSSGRTQFNRLDGFPCGNRPTNRPLDEVGREGKQFISPVEGVDYSRLEVYEYDPVKTREPQGRKHLKPSQAAMYEPQNAGDPDFEELVSEATSHVLDKLYSALIDPKLPIISALYSSNDNLAFREDLPVPIQCPLCRLKADLIDHPNQILTSSVLRLKHFQDRHSQSSLTIGCVAWILGLDYRRIQSKAKFLGEPISGKPRTWPLSALENYFQDEAAVRSHQEVEDAAWEKFSEEQWQRREDWLREVRKWMPIFGNYQSSAEMCCSLSSKEIASRVREACSHLLRKFFNAVEQANTRHAFLAVVEKFRPHLDFIGHFDSFVIGYFDEEDEFILPLENQAIEMRKNEEAGAPTALAKLPGEIGAWRFIFELSIFALNVGIAEKIGVFDGESCTGKTTIVSVITHLYLRRWDAHYHFHCPPNCSASQFYYEWLDHIISMGPNDYENPSELEDARRDILTLNTELEDRRAAVESNIRSDISSYVIVDDAHNLDEEGIQEIAFMAKKHRISFLLVGSDGDLCDLMEETPYVENYAVFIPRQSYYRDAPDEDMLTALLELDLSQIPSLETLKNLVW